MKKLRSFLRLSAADQLLLITSGLLLVAIRLGLWLVPFHVLRRFLKNLNRAPQKAENTDEAVLRRIVWAVSSIGGHFPRSCLSQALATQVMLGRRGYVATLRIGVALSEDGVLKAHAWLENNGKIIIGGSQSRTQFSAMPPLKEQLR